MKTSKAEHFHVNVSFKMDFRGLGWFLVLTNVLGFQQKDYKLIHERIEVASHNPAYFSNPKTHNFKHNRTHAASILKGETKVAYGYELKMEVQAYKMASNEYREFPLRFMFDYCESAARGEFGLGQLFACGNSTGCPFKKGFYTSCTWAPDGSQCPPQIPGGSYMLDLKLFYRSVEILFLKVYGSVKYPECKGCPLI